MESGWPFGASRATMPLQAIPSGSRVTDLDRSRIHLLITKWLFSQRPPPPSPLTPLYPPQVGPACCLTSHWPVTRPVQSVVVSRCFLFAFLFVLFFVVLVLLLFVLGSIRDSFETDISASRT